MFLNPIATKATPAAGAAPAAGTHAPSAGGTSFDRLLSSLQAEPGEGNEAVASHDEVEDRFLKLLIAQMNNQDPMNPLDNAQVTSQLAQINTVRGIVQLNETMKSMLERTNSGGITEASALLGRSVLVEGDALELPRAGDGPARGGFSLPEQASSVRIDVLDRSGAIVDSRLRSNLAAGVHTFEWDGRAGQTQLDPGRYTMRITASAGDRRLEATALSAQPVRAVVPGADGPLLQTGPGTPRPLSDVRAVL